MLNERSLKNLEGVHPDLVRVVTLAAERSTVPIVVTEGLRKLDRQRMLVRAGKSWTLDSRHLTGHAVDLVDANDFKYDVPDMSAIASTMKAAAKELGIKIVWGGDWKSKDTPHFELDRKMYPASGLTPSEKVSATVAQVATDPKVAVPAATGIGLSIPNLPSPPDVSLVSGWQSAMETVTAFGKHLITNPMIAAGFAVFVAAVVILPKLRSQS